MAKCGLVRVPEVRCANVTSVCRGGAACVVCGAVEVPCAVLWVAAGRDVLYRCDFLLYCRFVDLSSIPENEI